MKHSNGLNITLHDKSDHFPFSLKPDATYTSQFGLSEHKCVMHNSFMAGINTILILADVPTKTSRKLFNIKHEMWVSSHTQYLWRDATTTR